MRKGHRNRVVVALLVALLAASTMAIAPPTRLQSVSAAAPLAGEEIVSLRTRESKTFGTEDPGVLRRTIWAEPVHYRLDDAWAAVDNRLVAGRPGFLRNAANEFGLEIAQQPSEEEFLRFDHGDGLSVGWGALGARRPQRVTSSGSSVTLTSVWPNVDVEFQSIATGLKEDLILRSAAAQREFVFPLSVTGGSARLSATGEVEILDTAGAVRAVVPHGYMTDSAGSGLVGAESFGVTYELIAHGGGQALRVRLDDAWLDDPARVWPVRVDPNYLWYQSNSGLDDTYTAQTPEGDRSALSVLAIGHSSALDPAGRYRRAYMHFYVDSGLDVTKTALYLHNPTALTGCSAATVQVHRITSSWSGSSVRSLTNGAPTTSASFDASLSAPCGAGQETQFYSPGSNLTATVQGWSNGTVANNGLMIRAANESDSGTFNYREFHSANSGGSNLDRPYLEVFYNSKPAAPQLLSPASGSYTSLTPTLSGTFEDSLDNDTGRLFFEVYDNATSALVASGNATAYVGGGQSSSWTVPGGALAWGRTYTWRARAQDDRGAFGAFSGYWTFTPNTSPNTPTNLSPPSGAAVTTTPLLSGTYSDPDGDSGHITFEVIRSSDSVLVASGSGGTVASNGTSSWTVPPGSLANGTVYQWRARAVDAFGATSGYTSYRPFTAYGVPTTPAVDQLGLEAWWSYTKAPIGPQGDAWVNVASGNLVVQQLDATPVQAHGQLAFVLRRTYNSQAATLASLPGPLSAAGWSLNLSEAGDLTGAGLEASGLVAPSTSLESPGSVTLVDRDGTRHAFAPLAVGAAVNVAYLPGLPGGTSGPLAPRALSISNTGYTSICLDQTYRAPAGVHLALWRYIAVTAGPSATCTPLPGTTAKVLGFATQRPDRLRSEFAIDGKILAIIDGAGVELAYDYEQEPVAGTVDLGRLTAIYERTNSACATPTAAGCRSMQFAYPNPDSTVITDPAGRQTTYTTTGAGALKLLSSVTNPDGTTLSYTYGGCGGAAQQMCSASDPRGNTTAFSYVGAVEISPPRIATVTDRRGAGALPVTYSYDTDLTQVDQGNHRRRYDFAAGDTRVSRLREGDTANAVVHDTQYSWDTTAAPCRQPDNKVDNNLCRLTRVGSGGVASNEVTAWSYAPEGNVVAERRTLGAATLSTTFGYKVQQFLNSGAVTVINDQVSGDGNVTTPARAADTTVLFAISDRTQSLTPRGNAAGGGYAPYLTTISPDSAATAAPNTVPSGTVCQSPTAPTSNTGRVCQTSGPAFAPGAATVNRYTYDTAGQRLSWTTPKAIAEGGGSYAYTYYPDSARDLTGVANAGGWLKAVTDPSPGPAKFVAFAYDRAGNPVRTWDRDATAGTTIASYPATTNSAYREVLYGPVGHELDQPWRYVTAQRDPLGNRSTVTADANGNPTALRPARGNQAGNASYDTVQSFDAADQLTSTRLPENTTAALFGYDKFGNRTSSSDPNGDSTVVTYDTVNRALTTVTDRADSGTAPPGCRAASGADAPIPAGHVVCVTARSYDAVDNVTATTDATGAVSTFTFDALHRLTSRRTPSNDANNATLRTDTVYDPDGNPTIVCTPRQYSEGDSTCTTASLYATTNTYDDAGRLATTTVKREGTPVAQQLTTTSGYDGDGNLTRVTDAKGAATTTTYDLLGRKTQQAVPRTPTASNTTAWAYSPAGDLTSLTRPGGLISAYSYDAAHHLVDTVAGSSSPSAAAAGTPDPAGGTNTRSRNLYDPDGNIVGRYDPRAFATSVTAPDDRYLTRTDIDRNGRPSARWTPRYGGSVSDPALETAQATQCPATSAGRQPAAVAVPASMPTVPGFGAGVGVCVTTVAYDQAGNITRQTLPTSTGSDNRYLGFTWTNDGLQGTLTAPSPVTPGARVTAATYTRDGAGRTLQVLDPLGHGATTTYFPNGQVRYLDEQAGPAGTPRTTFSYDANGNTRTVVDPLAQTTTTVWTADNRTASVTDAAGNKTSYSYDEVGNPLTVKSPSANGGDANNLGGHATTSTFSSDNLLASTMQPLKGDGSRWRRTLYGYDAAGRKTSQQVDEVDGASPAAVTTPGGTQSFAFQPNDRLHRELGRSGETITHLYDPAGNPTSIADTTSPAATVTAGWYLDGLPRDVSQGGVANTYSYDGAARMTARQRSGNATTTFAYGDGGHLASLSAPDQGGTTTWAYDAAGRVDAANAPEGTALDWVYNSDDTLNRLTNTKAAVTVAQWDYTYDKAHRNLTQAFTGQAPAGGSAPTGTWTYTYDSANRVKTFNNATSTLTYGWDRDGNRTSITGGPAGTQTFSYNADDSIATDPNGSYSYNGAGALTNAACAANSYDGYDRLTATSSTGACGTSAASYTYDGLDRQRTRSDAGTTTTVGYDGLTTSTQAETTATTSLTWALTPNGAPVSALDQAAAVRRLYDDGTNNISTVTRDGYGLECAARFAPFGITAQADGKPCADNATPNTIWYRGERRDPSTGNYQMGSRTYNPTTASWLTPDTPNGADRTANPSVGTDPLTANSYSYVNGDPVNLSDPSGHRPQECDEGWKCKRGTARNGAWSISSPPPKAPKQGPRIRIEIGSVGPGVVSISVPGMPEPFLIRIPTSGRGLALYDSSVGCVVVIASQTCTNQGQFQRIGGPAPVHQGDWRPSGVFALPNPELLEIFRSKNPQDISGYMWDFRKRSLTSRTLHVSLMGLEGDDRSSRLFVSVKDQKYNHVQSRMWELDLETGENSVSGFSDYRTSVVGLPTQMFGGPLGYTFTNGLLVVR